MTGAGRRLVMPDAGELTLQALADRVGERFVICPAAGAPVETRLAEATTAGQPFFEGAREPFSVLFRATEPDRILPQGIYRIENDALGAMELFIVPLAPDADGVRYEAVFN